MKIAFYLENKNIADVDLTNPEVGNPGCGGTEFLFVATPYYLQKYRGDQYSPVIIANHIDRLPKTIQSSQADDLESAARQAAEMGVDIFIYRPRRQEDVGFLKLIDTLSLPVIGWAHITPKAAYLRKMAKTKAFKALICVEQEQYDQAQDTLLAAFHKLSFIVNGFDVEGFTKVTPAKKDEKLVTYLGALVQQKGFHLLAKVWPRILKRVPEAKLSVIGTGALYDHNATLGPWGLSDSEYETKHIIPYLSDSEGHVHSSVTFHGRLGDEKKEILRKTLIGVPNPTGDTENCPGSALEFQACGTACVSGAYWGMLDTIIEGETGLLGRTEQDLEDNIVTLLNNPARAIQMGQQGVEFVKRRYGWPDVIAQWSALLSQIQHLQPVPRRQFKRNFMRHDKWLIALNRLFQNIMGRFIFWPSVAEARVMVYSLLQKIKS